MIAAAEATNAHRRQEPRTSRPTPEWRLHWSTPGLRLICPARRHHLISEGRAPRQTACSKREALRGYTLDAPMYIDIGFTFSQTNPGLGRDGRI